ncbi:uncharacterized protein EV422DRAFT_568222 [Fimicolochytrium jonesii]|uniref:uncharacterized protein n=1 Tax=Fimicolochytrium jonesii TaxID=1396493 RepID=UPI0022FE4913|nr:uncharacterized protein EV422DRAFT_568222 [Fimicolochytrium jonesii]KAI8820257.1 hypothetical protein EV422DRAFT_568222 [Fimicolochytrium jonesii]
MGKTGYVFMHAGCRDLVEIHKADHFCSLHKLLRDYRPTPSMLRNEMVTYNHSAYPIILQPTAWEGGVIDLVKQEGEGVREKEEMRVLREQVRSLQERLGRQGEASGSGSGSGDGPAGLAAQSSSTA